MKITLGMPSFEALTTVSDELKDYYVVEVDERVIKSSSFSILVNYELEEGEEMPEETVGTPVEDTKFSDVEFQDGIQEWLYENHTGKVYCMTFSKMLFEKEEDAALFKLTWC